MRRHDDRALELYLLLHAVASADPWNVDESAKLWARALDLGTGPSATSAVSKIWKRLEDRQLLARGRVNRRASITLLREDGSGEPYSHPSSGRDQSPYFKLSFEYWTAADRWYRTLDLSATAVLLVGLSLPDEFILPHEQVKHWYGISADTAQRGLRALQDLGLLQMRKAFKEAPLSPEGYTEHRHYALRAPFGPRGYRSASARSRAL